MATDRADDGLDTSAAARFERFVAVLELGERFPLREPEPLIDLSPIWRACAERTAAEAAAVETRDGR